MGTVAASTAHLQNVPGSSLARQGDKRSLYVLESSHKTPAWC
jgi:uncharacterized lipoprotein